MLTATRVISRKALECSGLSSDIYTQRNFSSILRNVSDHFNSENEWKSFVTLSENVKNLIISCSLRHLLIFISVSFNYSCRFGVHMDPTTKMSRLKFSLIIVLFRPQPPLCLFTSNMLSSTGTSKCSFIVLFLNIAS